MATRGRTRKDVTSSDSDHNEEDDDDDEHGLVYVEEARGEATRAFAAGIGLVVRGGAEVDDNSGVDDVVGAPARIAGALGGRGAPVALVFPFRQRGEEAAPQVRQRSGFADGNCDRSVGFGFGRSEKKDLKEDEDKGL